MNCSSYLIKNNWESGFYLLYADLLFTKEDLMSIRFNALEALKIAERAEANAAKMYGELADTFADKLKVDFLKKMSEMEKNHEALFRNMQNDLPEKYREDTVFDPDNELGLYLDALTDAHVDEGSEKHAQEIQASGDLVSILRLAITKEKDAVLFYTGLKELVPEDMGKEIMDKIIKEEKGHMVAIHNELKKIKG